MHKTKDEKLEIRKFGIGLTVLLCLIGGWQLYKGHVNIYGWFFGFASLIIVLSFFAPIVLKPLFKVITTVGHAIGGGKYQDIIGHNFLRNVYPNRNFVKADKKRSVRQTP